MFQVSVGVCEGVGVNVAVGEFVGVGVVGAVGGIDVSFGIEVGLYSAFVFGIDPGLLHTLLVEERLRVIPRP